MTLRSDAPRECWIIRDYPDCWGGHSFDTREAALKWCSGSVEPVRMVPASKLAEARRAALEEAKVICRRNDAKKSGNQITDLLNALALAASGKKEDERG